ncbi:ABC-F family ATP-binding cassette domain-containing protein [uncultured Nocardioides sp.]|uniref:ABC-F family ATP-binding cassette domain-containing protein n=1 Tax=uncultured Nocardioides sp. TaxID=198441 RepID=UPI0025D47107|nr:ABC-F family ATP-binding cassette domain-containing protein [uncultured Nocardioides sp.]
MSSTSLAHSATTVTLHDLGVAFGARTLFSGLDLVLAPGDVTAVVGVNGSGKSTLMRTIAGDLPADAGSVDVAPADATTAWLPQVVPDGAESLLDYVRRRTGVADADARLQSTSEALAAGTEGADDAYADALERWLGLGAADLADRLPGVAGRVGLDVDPHRPLGTLSGGQAARACLVAVLLSQYDVLLLDEPTNNLDSRGLELMAEFVTSRPGPVLVASHDRAFLDRVVTSVVELDLHQQSISHHPGGWTDFVTAKEAARARARADYEQYAGARDALLAQSRQRREWADRGRRAVKRGDEPDKNLRERDRARADRQDAKAARTRNAVDRLDVVEQPRREWQLRYSLASGPPSADIVASLTAAVVHREAFTLGPVTLTVARGDRVAVLGDNGSGKSTLLAALLGDLELDAGRGSLGARVTLGVLDQERRVLGTDRSLLEAVRDGLGDADPADVRTLLAKFGLGSEHVDRPARSLSMGERTRALMAVFQGRAVNALVLDEPTNHLDVAGIEQLESAVAAYDGTVLLVSHDERFREAVGVTHEWRLEAGQVAVEAL